ncbi:MAG: hypothetical protein A2X86_03910 [Bdellovibrionales bacterium GWA2_49_15]|nr:MAG: hypothetical protein A2X86_03910 [Bdellovibrionales bacterium GWA2_49_15]HAZ12362.1 hypothetical protein [Bdellovibrionales bacterium]
MRLLICIVVTIFSHPIFAGLENAPPSINMADNRGKAVFVDFIKADYQIVYDLSKGSAWADSTITFENTESGYAIFDLVPEAASASVDEKTVTISTYNISGVTKVRFINAVLLPGVHTLKIRNQISENITFSGRQVKSAFWTDDLSDQGFLEQYLPSNLEFDQYKINFNVKIVGTDTAHEIFTNGEDKLLATNEWSVEFPEHFNTSSIFFHLTPMGAFRKLAFSYRSMDGREIPVVVYGNQDLNGFKLKIQSTLMELEKDYGPFPHQKVVVYGAGSGGMEYCGATISSLWALSHELTHSYFARGVMPASGNAGWIDEAVASWRDDGYRQSSLSELSVSRMAGHSPYTRQTDRDAYSKGARFMGYMDQLFTAKGGLKKFLRDFFERRVFKPFQTQDFHHDLELFFNQTLDAEFNKYIYATGRVKKMQNQDAPSPYHPRLTKAELKALL